MAAAAITVACNRGYRPPDDEPIVLDGGQRDSGTPLGGRAGGSGNRGWMERAGSGGFVGAAGFSTAGAGAGGATGAAGGAGGVSGAAGAAGAGEPKVDCTVDNGGCGDPLYFQCFPGYSSPAASCYDRDECATNNGGCNPMTQCFNVRGGPPGCGACPSGWTGDGKEGCTDVDECEDVALACGEATHYRCMNYEGYFECADVEECMTDNGGCGPTAQYFCIEQFGAAPECRENECFVDNGGCGSPDQVRCADNPAVTHVCDAKVAALAGLASLCLLRSDQFVDCVFTQQNGYHRYVNRYTQIASAGTNVCGIEPAGSVRCEGANALDASRPAGIDFTAVTVGGYHACALRSDGTLSCWGQDRDGCVSGPNGATGVRQVTAGAFSTCIVRNAGTIACFGTESSAELSGANQDGGTDFASIYTGMPGNVCALHTDGTAECWGNDAYGQLTGIAQASSSPFQSLAIGTGTICGLRSDGTVRCFGDDTAGQAAGPNAAGSGIAQVLATAGITCLRWPDGTFRCYGAEAAAYANQDPWARPAAP